MILSVIKFAEQCGVSRQAVYKAIKNGAIAVTADGKIDTETRDAIEYLAERTKNEAPRIGDNPTPKDKRAWDTERSKQAAIGATLKNLKTKGALAPKADVVKYVIDPICIAHTRILTDGAHSIAGFVGPMAKGGATLEELEAVVYKQLSGFLKVAKRDMEAFLLGGADGQ